MNDSSDFGWGCGFGLDSIDSRHLFYRLCAALLIDLLREGIGIGIFLTWTYTIE